ncbi:MAG TPA: corrinoid protein [Anaeromyxobacter sp.]|nr:corrinoid protein [Anaeromyxobacter sp.]HVP59392.1 corrinoid protein [Myxococcaceae bacterium]
MGFIEAIAENVQKGKASGVKDLVGQALAAGATPKAVLDEGLLAGMAEVSRKFCNNELYIPEILIAARAMNAGLALLRPHFAVTGPEVVGRVIIGTVKGDLHDLGKNLVKLMMEARGFEVIDLGVDVPAARFAQAASERRADIVACSALLTTTMHEMGAVMDALARAGLRGRVKTMVGGAPIDDAFSRSLGADAYAPNAASAAQAALALLTPVGGRRAG